MLTVTVEEGQKTVDQSKSPPPAPVLPNSAHRKVSPAPSTVKSSSTTLPKSPSSSSLTALPGTRPRRTTGRTHGTRNPDFQVPVMEQHVPHGVYHVIPQVETALAPPMADRVGRELRNLSPSSTTTSGTPSSRCYLLRSYAIS